MSFTMCHSAPRSFVDVRIDSPGREGLAGTAPAELHVRRRPRADDDRAGLPPRRVQPAWRQDFPVDWPQDRYVERRDFVKFLVLISGAFAVGQFWIATQNWWRRRVGHSDEVRRVASVDDVAVGGTIVFRYPGQHDPCVLVRLTASEFVAYSAEVHAPVVRGDSAARTGLAALPVSRRLLRLALGAPDGRAAAPPVAAGCARHPRWRDVRDRDGMEDHLRWPRFGVPSRAINARRSCRACWPLC